MCSYDLLLILEQKIFGLIEGNNFILKEGVLISIIIPVYNVGQLIQRCLDSVVKQIDVDAQLECILIDDCSTDDSASIVQRYISDYKGKIIFVFLKQKSNQGQSAARNLGINKAKGDYIFFLDSDDWLDEDCISCMLACLNNYPDSEIVQCGGRASDGSCTDWIDITKKKVPYYSNNPLWIKPVVLQRFLLTTCVWGKLIKRDFIVENNLYFQEGLVLEDELWHFFLAKKLSTISFCNKNKYNYYVNLSGTMSKMKNIDSKIRNFVKVWHVEINNIDDDQRDIQVKSIFEYVVPYLLQTKSIRSKFMIRGVLLSLVFRANVINYFPIFVASLLPSFILKRKLIWRILAKWRTFEPESEFVLN